MGSDTAAPGLGLGGGLREAWNSGPGCLPPCLAFRQVWSWIMLCRDIPLRYKTAAPGPCRGPIAGTPEDGVATSHPPTSICLCAPGYIISRGPRVVPLTGYNLVNDTFQLDLFLLLPPMVLGVWAGTQGESRLVGDPCPASMSSYRWALPWWALPISGSLRGR